jgi:hypothetical protein
MVKPPPPPAPPLPLADELEKLRAENDELHNQIAAMNEKIESLGKCGENGTCACSYEHPGDVCDFHSPTVVKLRQALENIIKHQSIVAGAMSDALGVTKIAKNALRWHNGKLQQKFATTINDWRDCPNEAQALAEFALAGGEGK